MRVAAQQLDRHLALEARIPAAVDRPERAVAERLEQHEMTPRARRRSAGGLGGDQRHRPGGAALTSAATSRMPWTSRCCSALPAVRFDLAPVDGRAVGDGGAEGDQRGVIRTSLMPHLRGETNQGPADGDADGGRRRAAGEIRDVLIVEPELDPRDDQLAIRLAQPLQRHFVAREQLPPDRVLERRRIVRRLLERERPGRRATHRPAQRVPKPVPERLADVGAERPFVLGGERLQPPHRLHQRILDDVLGVEVLSRPHRQPAVRPAAQPRQVTRAQLVARRFVTLARPQQQRKRRRWRHTCRRGRRQHVRIPGSSHSVGARILPQPARGGDVPANRIDFSAKAKAAFDARPCAVE